MHVGGKALNQKNLWVRERHVSRAPGEAGAASPADTLSAGCPSHADPRGGPGAPHPEVGHAAGGTGFGGDLGAAAAVPFRAPRNQGQCPPIGAPGRAPRLGGRLCSRLGHQGTATGSHFPLECSWQYSLLLFSSGGQTGGNGDTYTPHPTAGHPEPSPEASRSRDWLPGWESGHATGGEYGPDQARPAVLFGSRRVL